MVAGGVKAGRVLVVRANRQVVLRAVIATLALVVPLVILLYWLALPVGNWPLVLAIHFTVSILITVGLVSLRRMWVRVSANGVQLRRLLGRVTHVPASEIASVLLVEIYLVGALDALPHLFLLDSSGEVSLHLHGQIWPHDSMEHILAELSVPVSRIPDPLTMVDLLELRPQLAHDCALRGTRRAARLGI